MSPSAVTTSRREQVVDGEPVLADHEADAAAGRQTAHADRRGVAGGEGEAVLVRRTGEVAGGRAGLDAGGPRLGDRRGRASSPRGRRRPRPSITLSWARLWPPLRTDSGSPCSRAKSTAAATSCGVRRPHDRQRASFVGVERLARLVVLGVIGGEKLTGQPGAKRPQRSGRLRGDLRRGGRHKCSDQLEPLSSSTGSLSPTRSLIASSQISSAGPHRPRSQVRV